LLGTVLRYGDDATRADLEMVFDEIAFEPTDPHDVPLGGPDGPRTLRLEIQYTCDLATSVP
jgi:hypothetical protein